MAFPKKGSRTIIVDDHKYRWFASGNDGFIDLFVELENERGQRLSVQFEYGHEHIQRKEGVQLHQHAAITPDVVRQSIRIGLKNGWTPSERKKLLELRHIDEHIQWKR